MSGIRLRSADVAERASYEQDAAEAADRSPESSSEQETTTGSFRRAMPSFPSIGAVAAQGGLTASERAYGPARLRAGSGFDQTEFVKGTLWSKDEQGNDLPPSVDDIRQGKLFDCYLMAALAAVADSTPEKIVNMIEDHGRGVYTVHFGELGWSYVAPSVTADFTKPDHAKTTARNALWPLVIEKAYGVVKGGVG